MMKTFKMQFGNHNVVIKDISEGKTKAYVAKIKDLNNSLVFGHDLKELSDGIDLTFDLAKKRGIKRKSAPVVKLSKNPFLQRKLGY